MKKLLPAFVFVLALTPAMSSADPVRDWHDLAAVHRKVQNAIEDMARARAANHYDMDGHGAKAEDLLKQAEAELREAVESAKASKKPQ
jgi:hypothetical protein